MRRLITISVLALVLLSSRALPQQPPATGVIEGTVVRADNGEPIAGAHVTLTGGGLAASGGLAERFPRVLFSSGGGQPAAPAPPPRPSALQPETTGADGKFSFKGLNAGTYRLSATASGFVTTAYGQRTPFGQARPLSTEWSKTGACNA